MNIRQRFVSYFFDDGFMVNQLIFQYIDNITLGANF